MARVVLGRVGSDVVVRSNVCVKSGLTTDAGLIAP